MADALRGSMDASEYKHVALGLIFLKYISDAFEAKRAELLEEELADAEDPEEYLAENVFWVPKVARWSHLQAKAKQPTIGKDIDDAMLSIEANNASLKGVLPKDYALGEENVQKPDPVAGRARAQMREGVGETGRRVHLDEDIGDPHLGQVALVRKRVCAAPIVISWSRAA